MDFKCNKCKGEIDIHESELFQLYDNGEDLQEIECPNCGEKIYVHAVLTYDFTVCDEDGDEIDD